MTKMAIASFRIDIYKPVKKEDEIIECFFTIQINLAYRSTFSENQKIKHSAAYQCYFCFSSGPR